MSACPCLRFISAADVIVEEFPWGSHDWLVRDDLTSSVQLTAVRVTMPADLAPRVTNTRVNKSELWIKRRKMRRVIAVPFELGVASDQMARVFLTPGQNCLSREPLSAD